MEKTIYYENGYVWSYTQNDKTPFFYKINDQEIIWCDKNLFKLLKKINDYEYKKRDLNSRCVILNKNNLPIKCRRKCSNDCPYGYKGFRSGYSISINSIEEKSNFTFVDFESDLINKYDKAELINLIKKEIIQLTDIEKDIIVSIFYNNKTEREIAKKYGVSQSAIHQRLKYSLSLLKNKLKKYQL